MPPLQPPASELAAAYAYLKGKVRRTPLLESDSLNERAGCRVLVKAEGLQITGSFKIRGAMWRLEQLDADERRRGVVAFSSGNFAQGLAEAGRRAGVPVTIVMPEDAPAAKIEATRRRGATVELSRHGSENRVVVAATLAEWLAAERGLALLHPFDDSHVVAGQASLTFELLDQLAEQGDTADLLYAPVGGGGLIAGAGHALSVNGATAELVAVEPVGYDGMGRSLAAGARQMLTGNPPTLCDALQATAPGEVTFAAPARFVRRWVSVGDDDVRTAMAAAFEALKIVLEPSGAITLAAVLGPERERSAGRTVVVLTCGANVALEKFLSVLGSARAA